MAAKSEWKVMRPYFISLIKNGLTDKEIVPLMRERFKRKWTVHMIRSERGRLERAGEIKRGLSGSSKGKTKMTKRKKRKHQRWTMTAMLRAVELRNQGLKPETISRQLVREKQRREHNPGAVSDMFRRANLAALQGTLKEQELPLEKVAPKVVEASGPPRTIVFTNERGTISFSDLSENLFYRILQECLDAQFPE